MPHTTKATLAIVALFGLLGALALGGIAAVMLQSKGPTVRFATSFSPSTASGALGTGEDAHKGYTPTSAYIEEGADSEVTALEFNDDQPEAPKTGPSRLAEQTVQQTILNHQNDLIQCYASRLAQNPDLEGRVDFHFRIAPDGHVAMVKVTSSGLEDHPTEDCFIKAAKSWRFPKAQTVTKFDTNFDFLAG